MSIESLVSGILQQIVIVLALSSGSKRGHQRKQKADVWVKRDCNNLNMVGSFS